MNKIMIIRFAIIKPFAASKLKTKDFKPLKAEIPQFLCNKKRKEKQETIDLVSRRKF